ncbi:MAG: DUF421 domain-containing protein [Acidobacteria bacterium]|nr:DUF421 domain-containing protein [Acidobacteriota bacterium]MBI3471403.1 DUF421 domain-containing protein [Candidatus Solibacter usitatus]
MSFFGHDMLAPAIPVVEKIVRPALVYVFLVVCLRVFGKRQLAQLNPFDLVVLMCLSNTVQNAIIGNDNSLTGGLIGAFALLVVNYLVVRFFFGHRRLDQIFEGKPTVLIENGKIRRHALARELLTESELRTVAHRQGFRHLSEIQNCVLEPGGNFFVQGKAPSEDERFRKEVLDRLDRLSGLLEARGSRP